MPDQFDSKKVLDESFMAEFLDGLHAESMRIKRALDNSFIDDLLNKLSSKRGWGESFPEELWDELYDKWGSPARALDEAFAEELLQELYADSEQFYGNGKKPNELLNQYAMGYNLETLRCLLDSNDFWILKTALFIASELGIGATPVLESVIPHIGSEDVWSRDMALETVGVCAEGEHLEQFCLLLPFMEHEDWRTRWTVMNLFSNVGIAQLEAALKFAQREGMTMHEEGLRFLLDIDSKADSDVLQMLNHDNLLLGRYGAIAAKKLKEKYPELIPILKNSDRQDIAFLGELAS